MQQAQVIRLHTNFQVGHYVGSMGTDFWDLKQWQEQFVKQDVLVMTYKILHNILQAAFITVGASACWCALHSCLFMLFETDTLFDNSIVRPAHMPAEVFQMQLHAS